jgi:cyanophycinase
MFARHQNNTMQRIFFIALIVALYGYSASAQPSPITVRSSVTRHGPEKGSLIIIGGGGSTPEIWKKFTDTRGSNILIGDHTQGLGFLRNSVIDQHLLRRNREFDLTALIRKAPELIGVGLDEATAILVQRDTLEVIGKSYVAIYDYNNIVKDNPFFLLSEGQKYDLADRKVLQAPRRRDAAQPVDR